MAYFLYILNLIGIYATVCLSLNLLAGYTGLLSIAQAAFFGVGAYTTAILALGGQTQFLLNLLAAMVVSGLAGALVGALTLRFDDDYFVVATFAFQVIAFGLMNNWVALTGGPMGLEGVPRPFLFGHEISSNAEFLIIVWGLCGGALWLTRRVDRSAYGRVLRAIREDEVFAAAQGRAAIVFKRSVFVAGAALAGIAGGVYAQYMQFLDPSPFTVQESISIISMMIIGGAGTLWGPVVGAAVLVSVPEFLRFAGVPSAMAANVRQMLYGGLLVGFMMWRPQGLCGRFFLRGRTDTGR
jgi:branched-chain amino acid transport system permease protein